MAKVTYKSYNQNDSLLFPHCIGDFIPENDPVRVLDAIVEHLDISAIEATYKGGGASSFAPRMLLKLILYAYLQNIHSGRKMEALLKRDVNFMWLSGMQRPDFVGTKKETSDLGYTSTKSLYQAKDCSNCPLRGMCYKGKCRTRTIEVNHRNNELRAMARELLTSDEGLMHRSRRPIEPEVGTCSDGT